MSFIINKPSESEYNPYVIMYFNHLPDDGLVLETLEENITRLEAFIYSLPPEKLNYRYAPGKWSIKEILIHLSDTERVLTYRALRFGRGDGQQLAMFNQEEYAMSYNEDNRDLKNIFDEFKSVRASTMTLLNSFAEDDFLKSGIVGAFNVSVRALVYHIAGHELYHLDKIKTLYL